MGNVLDIANLFKFNLYWKEAQTMAYAVVDAVGYPVLLLAASLEFTRQLYANLIDGEEIRPLSVFLPIAIFGVVFINGSIYTKTMDLFIVQPLLSLNLFLAGNASTNFTEIIEKATSTLAGHSLSPYSFVKALMFGNVWGSISLAVFVLSFASIYAILVLQKVMFALLIVVGPVFGPFIMFKPFASFFHNWLKALIAVCLWGLIAAIVVKLLFAIGLTEFAAFYLTDSNLNPIRLFVISFAILFMVGSIISLTGQLFGFSFISPVSAGTLFAMTAGAAFAGAQMAVKSYLKKIPILQSAIGKAEERMGKTKSTQANSPIKDKIEALFNPGRKEFRPLKDPAKASPGKPTFRDKLLNRGKTIKQAAMMEGGKDKVTLPMIDERTGRLQAGLFRQLAVKFALAKNPLPSAADKVFFGGVGAGQFLFWKMDRGDLTHDLLTPVRFSKVKNIEEFHALAQKLPHFSRLSNEERGRMVQGLLSKGYSFKDVTQAMEIIDHNFRKYEALDTPESIIQKVMDINNQSKFKSIIHGRYDNVSETELWKYFRTQDPFKGVSRKDFDSLVRFFSPGFVMASAKYLQEHSSIGKENALSYLKSFMTKNKPYDKFTPESLPDGGRMVIPRPLTSGTEAVHKAVLNTLLFKNLTSGQIDGLLAISDRETVICAAQFADISLDREPVPNPYKTLRDLVKSMEEAGLKPKDKKPINDNEILNEIKKSSLSVMDQSRLTEKYTPYTVLTAINAVRSAEERNTSLEDKPSPLFNKNVSKEEAISYVRSFKDQGGFEKTDIKTALFTLSALQEAGVSENSLNPQIIKDTVRETRFTETGINCAFYPMDSKEFRTETIRRFIASGGVGNEPFHETINLLHSVRETISNPLDIKEELVLEKKMASQALNTGSPGATNDPVFTPNTPLEEKTAFLETFSHQGGLNGLSINESVELATHIRRESTISKESLSHFKQTIQEDSFRSSPNESEAYKPAGAAPDEIAIEAIQTNETLKNVTINDLVSRIETLKSTGQSFVPAPGDKFKEKVETFLEECFVPRDEYSATPQDFYTFVEKRTDIRFNMGHDLNSEAIKTPPDKALKIVSELNDSVGLSCFSKEELTTAVNDISADPSALKKVTQEKSRAISIKDAKEIIKSLPPFKEMEETRMEEFLKMGDPSRIAALARSFAFEIEGMDNIDLISDFEGFIRDGLENPSSLLNEIEDIDLLQGEREP